MKPKPGATRGESCPRVPDAAKVRRVQAARDPAAGMVRLRQHPLDPKMVVLQVKVPSIATGHDFPHPEWVPVSPAWKPDAPEVRWDAKMIRACIRYALQRAKARGVGKGRSC